MSNPLSDQYWEEEFAITKADLDRVAKFITQEQTAQDLAVLAHRVVYGRLQFGADPTPSVQTAIVDGESVRLWDAEKAWKVGNRVIVPVEVKRDGKWIHGAFVGTIIKIGADKVQIRVEALDRVIHYNTKPDPKKDHSYERWRTTLQKIITSLAESSDLESQADAILLKHEHVTSLLLSALQDDKRFAELMSRWFLRELAILTELEQLATLAWAMAPLDAPQLTAELVPLIEPPLTTGDSGLFGLYLALQQHPELFENADSGLRPRWRLAGPPPGSRTARHAAYDPKTYEVLCIPGELIAPAAVRRLWELELLRVVV